MGEPQIQPESDNPTPQIVAAPDYVTRAEFETALGALRDDLKAQIDSALKDMRDMLNQSLKANSDQRDMINTTLESIQTSIETTIAARDSSIEETRRDVNKLQEQTTQTQIDIANLTTQVTTLTETVRIFVDENLKRAAELEGKIEDNRIWIERRRKFEKNILGALRPVLQLPRWAKWVAALAVLASGGAQWQLDWLDYLLDIFR